MNSLQDDHYRPLFPRGPGLGLKTLLLMALALTLLFYDVRGDSLRASRSWAAYTLSPIVWLASVPGSLVDMARGVDTRSVLERENRELREKQLVLDAHLSRMQALEAENRRLRELLASSAKLPEQVLIAEIVAVSQDPYRYQIVLNRGSRDGIYLGQGLVDAYGVMGQITDVSPNQSRALLVTDPNHGIPVEINRTGLQTIAVGLGDERGLRLPFLPSNADIKPGDLLVSSSLGGRFPAGYPVATVYRVKPVAGEHFMDAYAYPAARLNQGRQALLVWNRQREESATAPPAADSGKPIAPVPAPATAAPTPPPAAAQPSPPPAAPAPAAPRDQRPAANVPPPAAPTAPATAAPPARKPETQAPRTAPAARQPVPTPAPGTRPATATPPPTPAAPKPAGAPRP